MIFDIKSVKIKMSLLGDFVPTTANFVCDMNIAHEPGIAHDFGYDFKPRGNFTFVFVQNVL